METAAFGRAPLEVSRVGFGCAAIGGYDYGRVDDAESLAAIDAAIGAGITLFDVADVYGLGHAEVVLGRAIAGRRSSVVVATKVGVRWDDRGRTRYDLSPAYVTAALEASLRRLRTDYVDLYQIHWPDPATPIAETMEALVRLRDAGKVRALGACNLDAGQVAAAQRAGRLEGLQLPLNLAQLEREADARHCARAHGMAVMPYNALAQGLFTGKYDRGARFGETDLRQRSDLFQGDALARNLGTLEALRAVAARHGRTPAQVALRWLLDHPAVTCVLAGAKRAEQSVQNAAAADGRWRLTVDEHGWLERVARGLAPSDPADATGPSDASPSPTRTTGSIT